MKKLIDQIDLPEGLHGLSVPELEQISNELRDELIESVSSSGGHFASSLGVTEITVALHSVFDTPYDKLIWDVGHQAYIHKMLTGRRGRMHSIRNRGGISGFLKPGESDYDVFGAGHASTSISAAVGTSIALSKKSPAPYVISVIGDGSMTGGMAFEAMNHAGELQLKRFIVILNDNDMSISPNVGAISRLFSLAVTSQTSNTARRCIKDLLREGYMPEFVYKVIDRAEEATQGFFASASMLFESFGFRYIGPVDGHNMKAMVAALEHAKTQDRPVLIHAYTNKGQGYEPAENDPVKWHGVVPFDRERGEFVAARPAKSSPPPSYTSVFGKSMCELAGKDSRVIAITAAMASGTGLDTFASKLPEQFYDVGICEQHAVTLAAGAANQGMRPVCAIYSTFLQRAYDQIVHDVCIQNLPVVFAMDRAGVVGNDGETHHGVFDIAYLRSLPNMVLMSPRDENELRHMLYTALQHNGPIAIRYPRGNGQGVELEKDYRLLPIGKSEVLQTGQEVLMLCYGPLVSYALQAAEKLLSEAGISSTVVDCRFAKPLDAEMLARELPRHQLALTLEDHAIHGGFGSAVLELINNEGIALENPLRMFGVSDAFVPHASQSEQHSMQGYDAAAIFQYVMKNIRRRQLAAAG